ncbi:hypothetical protein [Amycolatopsis sp. cmx-4-54]|uniref:hypothetical protein n=1 Tax=Amycolatopsis sp. cmx-4-54 TaxID=2790936 RepID=UPI003978F547
MTASRTRVLLGLLVLRWLIAQQTRKPKTHTWRFDAERPMHREALRRDYRLARRLNMASAVSDWAPLPK